MSIFRNIAYLKRRIAALPAHTSDREEHLLARQEANARDLRGLRLLGFRIQIRRGYRGSRSCWREFGRTWVNGGECRVAT
jgi:hypothetical protein